MLRALWVWQRWSAAAELKVRRIALDNAFAASQALKPAANPGRFSVLPCPIASSRIRGLIAVRWSAYTRE